jgi:hypothetical protein
MTATGALERVVRRSRGPAAARPQDERCELCAQPVPEEHRHVLDLDRGELLCSCTACSLLFDREAAAEGRRRLVPARRLRLEDELPLDVPVGLAFFVKSSAEARVVARYPSPIGATTWDLDVSTWDELERTHPALSTMEPDVEALLVNTARGANERWIVPIDDCYRLVAIVRRSWRGLSGGTDVWQEIEGFFGSLEESG